MTRGARSASIHFIPDGRMRLILFVSLTLAFFSGSRALAQTPGPPQVIDPSANLEPLPCAQTARRIPGEPGASAAFVCPGHCERQPVWGSGPYSDDSSICGAALHAGLSSLRAGGPIEVHFLPGQSAYTGSERNGVRSHDWGPWRRSFVVTLPGDVPQFDADGNWIPIQESAVQAESASMARIRSAPLSESAATMQGELIVDETDDVNARRARRRATRAVAASESPEEGNQRQGYAALHREAEVPGQVHCELRGQELTGAKGTIHTVYCPSGCRGPSVWGTDLYADDSSVCAAAIHAGIIEASEGGVVQIKIGGPQQGFIGSERNGITSASWRAWPRSFTVWRPGQVQP